MPDTAERLLITIWIGSLWCIGYVVAPALFAVLDDRAMAGSAAGELFRIETWISLGCFVLLAAVWTMAGRFSIKRIRVPAFIVALLAISEWLVGPRIAAARLDQGADSELFAWLHGLSAGLYLVASLLGIWLVVRPQAKQ